MTELTKEMHILKNVSNSLCIQILK